MFGLSQQEIESKEIKDALNAIITLLIENGIITKEQFIKRFEWEKIVNRIRNRTYNSVLFLCL